MAATKGITKTCDLCSKEVGVYAFKRHLASCTGDPGPTYPKPTLQGGGVLCPDCGKGFPSLGQFKLHYKKHLGRHTSPGGWNKGLTAVTDDRMQQAAARWAEGR